MLRRIAFMVFALASIPAIAETRLIDHKTSPLVFNGTKSEQGEFEPMGWIGNCTGTLVAPNVIITAAHCTRTGARITFSHRGTGRGYPATCTNHPRYNTRTVFNDYAFCKLDTAIEGAQMVSLDMGSDVATGEKLLMNGLGAPNVRVHYWGSANVRSINGQDIVTCGPSRLGGGDSGGSLLRWSDDRRKTAKFKVVGINSRGDVNGPCSYFNRLTHPEFKDFVARYEAANGVKLCGASRDCSGGTAPPAIPEECKANMENLAKLSACSTVGGEVAECKKAVTETKACYAKLVAKTSEGK